MILLSIRIRGSIGIKNGLGLEDITVDFTKFANGLIVIEGPNGAGKTTFIENLTPYLFLKSRPGALAKQYYLKDSCRDLLVQIGDDQYRFLVTMNGTTGKIIDRFVEKNGECMNKDGKEETYNAIVQKLFGDADLFFSSLFMPQRRVPFSKLDPAKRKDLLLELIGAGHLQAKCEVAIQSGKVTKEKLQTLTAKVEAVKQSGRSIESVGSDITELTAAKTEFESQAVTHQTNIQTLSTELDTLTKKSEEQAVTVSKLSGARARLHELQGRLDTETGTGGRKVKMVEQMIAGDEAAVKELEIQTEPHVLESINTNLERLAKAKATHGSNIAGSSKHSELRVKLVEANAALERAIRELETKKMNAFAEVKAAERTRDSETDKYETEKKRSESDISKLMRSVDILNTVPCQSEPSVAEKCKSCQFLKDATVAITEVAKLTGKRTENDIAWLERRSALVYAVENAQGEYMLVESADGWPERKQSLEEDIQNIKDQMNALDFDSDQANKAKAELQRLEAENFPRHLLQYETRVKSLEEARTKLADRRTQLTELQSEITAKVNELTGQVAAAQAEVGELQAEIDTTVDLRIRDSRDHVKKAREAESYCSGQVAKLTAQLERLAEELALAEVRQKKLTEDQVQLTSLQNDLADYEHLAQALSRNGGFQSMLVESAGAEMTPFANELLTLYGRPWTIEIATCRPSADNKKMVDGFFVIVNTPDGPRELSDLSGGEEVIVDQVIYDAIGNMLRRRSGLDLKTSIKDEADGALDGDRAIAYVKAIESAHQVSHLHHTIMISHRESIQQLIPQKLVFVPKRDYEIEGLVPGIHAEV